MSEANHSTVAGTGPPTRPPSRAKLRIAGATNTDHPPTEKKRCGALTRRRTTKRRDGWDCERGAAAKGFAHEGNWTSHATALFDNYVLLLFLDPAATMVEVAEAIDRRDHGKLRLARERLDALDAPNTQADIDRQVAHCTGRDAWSDLVPVD